MILDILIVSPKLERIGARDNASIRCISTEVCLKKVTKLGQVQPVRSGRVWFGQVGHTDRRVESINRIIQQE